MKRWASELGVGLSGGRDAIRFLDGEDQPVLALVDVQRFIRWLDETSEPALPVILSEIRFSA